MWKNNEFIIYIKLTYIPMWSRSHVEIGRIYVRQKGGYTSCRTIWDTLSNALVRSKQISLVEHYRGNIKKNVKMTDAELKKRNYWEGSDML